jgi:hypothetical protein
MESLNEIKNKGYCQIILIICIWFIISFITYYILSLFNLEKDAIITLSLFFPFIIWIIYLIIKVIIPLENEN